jgi:hypothetical protein
VTVELLAYVEDDHNHIEAIYDPANNEVTWSSHWAFDRENWECTNDRGRFTGDAWLDALAEEISRAPQRTPRIYQVNSAPDLATFAWSRVPDEPRSHFFLDSFSVIENGEDRKRRDRIVRSSPATTLLLDLVNKAQVQLATLTPREFEVLCASALAQIGFSNVVLRRYVKDGGADILGILADGPRPEVVLVEAKHGQQVSGIQVLDRLNGARDRIGADRALLITSSHVAREGMRAYNARSQYLAAHTWAELQSWLRDSPDWSQTPLGLWTKREPERNGRG